MFRKLVSLVTVVTLICCFCGVSVYAKGDDPKELTEKSSVPPGKKEVNEKLKADMAKLVSDAKAGKLKMPKEHFPQPQRNNLSTGAKIAIFAGIGAGIFLIILFASLADDDS